MPRLPKLSSPWARPLRKKLYLIAVLAAAASIGAGAGGAQAGVIDQVRESGILLAGTRADSPPFGFVDSSGHLAGFSVDLLKEIVTALSAHLGKPIRLELKPVTPETRTGMIHHAAIQIECGITTATWERRHKADFSLPFFVSGTRVLTHRSFGEALDNLAGKRIGVVADSTTRKEVEAAVPKATIVEVPDMSRGMALFRQGQIDALSNIGVVLRGLIEESDERANLILLPRAGAIQYEPIACMLPANDFGLARIRRPRHRQGTGGRHRLQRPLRRAL